MNVDHSNIDLAALQQINAQASVFMKEGIRLLSGGMPDAVARSLECFDRALDLRRSLPVERYPLLRYDVAACWLNRAEALMQQHEMAATGAAVHACDEAIALLEALPLDHDPRFPRRLAIAYQHRGLALQAQRGPGDEPAMDALMTATAILARDCSAGISDRQFLLGAIWIDVANARLAAGTEPSRRLALAAAITALSLVAALERDDADAADVGLKARHARCRALSGKGLSRPMPSGTVGEDVHEATDLADEGLALVQYWENRGVARFRAIAHDLFRFGARVYAQFQPQFLREFVQDHLDPARSSEAYVNSVEMRLALRDLLS